MRTIESNTSALRPSGTSRFVVDMEPFDPKTQIELAQFDLDHDKVLDWPVVYILTNETEAYVGQTTSVATRIMQHAANKEKEDFNTVNVIYHDEFNASVITDYEHRLIGLMHADGHFRLTNKNGGMTETSYFSKDEYGEMFDDLWEELRTMQLVYHTIDELEESEVFKYSPYKGLTVDQKVALDKIMLAIQGGLEDAKPIVVEGMPGTGKTVFAIYLLKMLKDDPAYEGMNIRLVEPVTSLRETLRASLECVVGLSSEDIISPTEVAKEPKGCDSGTEKSFDILLVDESHKLKQRVNLGTQFHNYDVATERLGLPDGATQMDWIKAQAKLPVFFYDPLQCIGPSCLGMDEIRESLGSALDNQIELYTQMRVKGGKGYLDYIQQILRSENPDPQLFDGYDVVLHEDFSSFVESFESTRKAYDLTRMIAGYAWQWRSNPKKCKDPSVRDIVIDGIGLKWNCTYDNWVVKGTKDPDISREVGCIHSIQGYDLSYAYVIIGDDLYYDETAGELKADKSHYFDRNGKATASQDELDQYIKNIYYVLLTRGIEGTHIYAANPKMRNYLAAFLEHFSSPHF